MILLSMYSLRRFEVFFRPCRAGPVRGRAPAAPRDCPRSRARRYSRAMRRGTLHRWLAAVPALLILVGVPFANRVHRLVMGLPFLLLWIVGCVLLTSVVMAVVGSLDAVPRRQRLGLR